MILTIKHKFNIYRRFEQDIWGMCYTDTRIKQLKNVKHFEDVKLVKSPYFKFFYKLYYERKKKWELNRRRYIYRLDIIPFKRIRKKFKKRFLSIRLTRLYFLTFQDHQFRKLFKRSTKMDGIWSLIIVIF